MLFNIYSVTIETPSCQHLKSGITSLDFYFYFYFFPILVLNLLVWPMRVGIGIWYGTSVETKVQKTEQSQREKRVNLTGEIHGLVLPFHSNSVYLWTFEPNEWRMFVQDGSHKFDGDSGKWRASRAIIHQNVEFLSRGEVPATQYW